MEDFTLFLFSFFFETKGTRPPALPEDKICPRPKRRVGPRQGKPRKRKKEKANYQANYE
jgi:hypothetical protein